MSSLRSLLEQGEGLLDRDKPAEALVAFEQVLEGLGSNKLGPEGQLFPKVEVDERTGEFAKAEDALHALIETGPDNPAIVEFGLAFYHRLLTQSDATLNAAKLPRSEAEEGLRELELRKVAVRAHDLPDIKANQP